MQLTPANWNKVLAPNVPWQEAYAAVEAAVKALYEGAGPLVNHFTTAELVETLYPETWARGEGITARKRIFGALKALAKHQLKDYCEPGEPRPLKHNKNRLVTPLIWRAPLPKPSLTADVKAAVRATIESNQWSDIAALADAVEATIERVIPE